MELKQGQIWRHLKGFEVEIICLVKNEAEELVVLKHKDKEKIWIRPITTWLESVDKTKDPEKKQNIRFKYIKDTKESTYFESYDYIEAEHTETNEIFILYNGTIKSKKS